ncbi:MAG: carboxypeptidase regulatory-like domain-containing protein [Acidobacteriia bacterium]|nr:carboxypeptidase regulatory-like domain-containing protein [Terriglobia bacterium]MBV8902378.1 carboxypeptidase regulatory-like domain-containing protein [Terriglobia bacterium]
MIPRVVARTHGAPRSIAILVALVLLVSASALFGQKKKDDQGNTRSVQGEVTAQDDSPVAGAVVQLKNTKTLQIRSFITKENGSYYFNGLSPDVDYELRAESQGLSSSTKTLSSFDSRKAATINLKLNKK